jgi:hypothetical protein
MQPKGSVLHQRLCDGLINATAATIDWLDAVFVVSHVEFGADIQHAFFTQQRLACIPFDVYRGADRGLDTCIIR